MGRLTLHKRNNYLNMSSNVKTTNISAKPETLQVYSFASSDGHYDQLVMKAWNEQEHQY